MYSTIMANLFFIHTPFHQFIVEKIINQYKQNSNEINIIFYEFERPQVFNQYPDAHKLMFVGGRVPGIDNRKNAEINVKLIKSIINNYTDNKIYISDIAWPMNNILFFDKSIKCEFNIFMDGIGNYLGQKINARLFVRNIAKWLLGFFGLGVRYFPYFGDVVGHSQKRIKLIYGFKSEYLHMAKNKACDIIIKNSQKEIFKNQKKGIFLDQPFIKGFNRWNALRQDTLKILNELDVDHWHYKQHHFGALQDKIYFLMLGFEDVNSTECIEKLFESEWFDTVVSYNSTALFNLKVIFGDRIRCIAIDDAELVNAATQNDSNVNLKLRFLYNTVGVEIISINI